jgi:hypothetical protein
MKYCLKSMALCAIVLVASAKGLSARLCASEISAGIAG